MFDAGCIATYLYYDAYVKKDQQLCLIRSELHKVDVFKAEINVNSVELSKVLHQQV